jgi:hypothetical protein
MRQSAKLRNQGCSTSNINVALQLLLKKKMERELDKAVRMVLWTQFYLNRTPIRRGHFAVKFPQLVLSEIL